MSAMTFGDVTTVEHKPLRPQSHPVLDETISQADLLLTLASSFGRMFWVLLSTT